MSYYDSELPTHVSGKKLRHHLKCLQRSGLCSERISVMSGVPDTTIDDIMSTRPDKVPFEVADSLYTVVAADRPLETPVDTAKAVDVLQKVANLRDCSLEEAGRHLNLPDEAVSDLLHNEVFTLRHWQTMAEKSKKLGVRVSGTA